MDLEFETEIFAGDTQARTNAVIHIVKSRGSEGLVALLLKILDHIYDLENP